MYEQTEPTLNKNMVVTEIGVIRDQISVMGFNDSEIPALNKLMVDVQTGKTDPQKALTEAHSILNRKQDYH